LRETTEWLVTQDLNNRFGGATAYLRACARVLGAHYHLKAALAEGGQGARTGLAKFYITRLLPEYEALLTAVREGSSGLFDLSPDDLAA
jgi:hypothetical protein